MITRQTTSAALLLAVVAIFLIILGNGIQRRTHAAVAPPIYDPIAYYTRASYVWDSLAKWNLKGAFNGPFANRPPGSSVILYPLGFRHSVRSFLFRSVFAPLLIWALGLCILILPTVRRSSDALLGGCLIAGLITMPFFFQFEPVQAFITNINDAVSQWGLVDGLEGAVGVLALGFMYTGVARSSLILSLAGWLAGAFSIFIKPSGMLIIPVLLGVATVELLIRYCQTTEQRRAVLKFGILILAAGVLVFGGALWIALHTDYLSGETISAAKKARDILIDLDQTPKPALFAGLIRPVIGWWWFCPMVIAALVFAAGAIGAISRRELPATGLRLAASAVIGFAAIWWWLYLAGPQRRYLFPFLLMLMAWFIPDVFTRLQKSAAAFRVGSAVYCLIPFCILSGMLWSGTANIAMQKLMGVNLTSDHYGDEVKTGEWLLAQSEALKRPLQIYTTSDGWGVGVVEMTDYVDGLDHGYRPARFVMNRPNNWADKPGLRVQELLKSDFILLELVRPKSAPNGTSGPADWKEEVERFKQLAYFESGIDRNGLELVSDGEVKLLRVADAPKFKESICQWAQSAKLGNGFYGRNKDFWRIQGEGLLLTVFIPSPLPELVRFPS